MATSGASHLYEIGWGGYGNSQSTGCQPSKDLCPQGWITLEVLPEIKRFDYRCNSLLSQTSV